MVISGYSKLNYHRLLMVIDGYFIGGYWWLLIATILVTILLMDIGGY